MKRAILILGFLLMAGNTHATTGNQLLNMCDKKEADIESAYCMGYVAGTFESRANLLFCPPLNPDIKQATFITYGQMVKVVLQYLKKNPSRLHKLGADLVQQAYQEAWPCEKNN